MMASRKQGPGFSGLTPFTRSHPKMIEMLRRRQDTADIRRAYFQLHSTVQEASERKIYRQRRAFSAAEVDRKPSMTQQRREVSSARARVSGRRHERSNDTVTEYDALTRTFVPLPKLHGQPSPTWKYERRNIREWQNEVTKVVPKRPRYSLKAHIVTTGRPPESAPVRQVLGNPTLFYRVDRQNSKGKEYVIYPDWVSEGHTRCQGRLSNARLTVQLAWG